MANRFDGQTFIQVFLDESGGDDHSCVMGGFRGGGGCKTDASLVFVKGLQENILQQMLLIVDGPWGFYIHQFFVFLDTVPKAFRICEVHLSKGNRNAEGAGRIGLKLQDDKGDGVDHRTEKVQIVGENRAGRRWAECLL